MKRRLIVVANQELGGGDPTAAPLPTGPTESLERKLEHGALADTIALAQGLDFGRSMEPPELVFAYRGDRQAYQRLLSSCWLLVPQMGADLAQHLDNLLIVLGAAPDDQTLFLGPATPHLSARALQNAYIALGQRGVALGPEEQRGIYLLGVTGRWPCGILSKVRWPTRHAQGDLCNAFRRAHLSVSLLPPFYAIRAQDDLRRLQEDLGIYPDRCLPHLRLLLEAIGTGRLESA